MSNYKLSPEMVLTNKVYAILEPCKNSLKKLVKDINKINNKNKHDLLFSMILACLEVIDEAELELPYITINSISHIKIRLSELIFQLPRDIEHNGIIAAYSKIGSFITDMDLPG